MDDVLLYNAIPREWHSGIPQGSPGGIAIGIVHPGEPVEAFIYRYRGLRMRGGVTCLLYGDNEEEVFARHIERVEWDRDNRTITVFTWTYRARVESVGRWKPAALEDSITLVSLPGNQLDYWVERASCRRQIRVPAPEGPGRMDSAPIPREEALKCLSALATFQPDPRAQALFQGLYDALS